MLKLLATVKKLLFPNNTILIGLAFFALSGFLAVEYSRASTSCISSVNSPSDLKDSIRLGLVKDFYEALPEFPRIKFNSIRPIQPIEVQSFLDELALHSKQIRRFAETVTDPTEKRLLIEYSEYTIEQVRSFVKMYDSFQITSLVLDHLVMMSNLLKGRGFEVLIGALLRRSGFEGIRMNQNLRSKDLGVREVDFIAYKDGIQYVFEVKTIKPEEFDESGYYHKKIDSILSQLRKLSVAIPQSENKGAKLVVIFHFNLGNDVKQKLIESGADEVIFLRRKYMDDWSQY